MKIGIVDLDTSHPGNWVPIIRAGAASAQFAGFYRRQRYPEGGAR